jgi:hypothetical protein
MSFKQICQCNLAEAVRFELTEDSHPRRFSRPVHSTALPRFQFGDVLF